MFSLRFMRGGGGYKKKIMQLASEPVGGRSRATELPCFLYVMLFQTNWS